MRKRPERVELSALTPASIVLAPQSMDGEPYTTSEIIAEGTGIEHRKLRDTIRKYKTELETFGVSASYQAETPSNQEGGRKVIGYILNEQQATFLLTLLKNTPVVVELEEYQRKEAAIAVLLDAGLCYDTIKAALAGEGDESHT